MLLQLRLNGILYGIFIGGAIGFAFSIKNKLAMMAICGFAYFAPLFILNPEILGLPNPWLNDGRASFIFYASSPLFGFCFGILVGLLWRGWKTGIVFGLASSLIFTIGFWINLAAMSFVWGQGMVGIVDVKNLSTELSTVHWLASDLIYGGIIGILWGILLDRLPRIRQWNLPVANS
jgi:hypothetical protein